MAALVIAAAGSALGGAVLGTGVVALGLTGNAIGYLAGSLLASAFTPAQKSEGPRLQDLQVTGSAYGTPIPYVQGHPGIAGQIVYASQKREIATTTSQGKGGGGSEYTSYSYEVDLFILLTDNPIIGVRRIWLNGELVSTAATNATDGSLVASATSPHWRRLSVYSGDPAQLPDPTYEAAVGTANADAYRGRGGVFIEGLQLGGGGQIPNLVFEVNANGTPGSYSTANFHAPLTTNFLDVISPAASESHPSPSGTAVISHGLNGVTIDLPSTPVTDYPTEWSSSKTNMAVAPMLGVQVVVSAECEIGGIASIPDGYGNVTFFGVNSPTEDRFFSFSKIGGIVYLFASFQTGGGGGTDVNVGVFNPAIKFYRIVFRDDNLTTEWQISADGVAWSTVYSPSLPRPPAASIIIIAAWAGFGGAGLTYRFKDVRQFTGLAAVEVDTFSNAEPTLAEVVSALCLRTGLTAGQIDVTGLSSITQTVRGLTATVNSARSILDMLSGAYFTTASLSDKIYFRPLGGASVVTIPYEKMGWANGDVPASMNISLDNELEIPAQTALTYQNNDADYLSDTQYSDRLLTGQTSTSVTQLPMVFTPSEAKKIADASVALGAIRAASTSVTLGLEYAHLEPGDVFIGTAKDGSTYRLFIQQRRDADFVITLDCVLDDSTIFTQPGTTSGGSGGQTEVLPIANTQLELLDIAILRDADDRPGHYVAVKGDAVNWSSCALFVSLDDVSYTQVSVISEQSVIGVCSTTLPAWTGGNVWDLTSTVTVNVGLGELSSYTEADVLNGVAPGYLIGDEIVYAQTATLVSAGVYTLSRFLRARLGTEWATHTSSERFVVLSTSGLRFIPMDASELGKLRYYKAVSAGQRLTDVAAKQITPMGTGLEPLSGVNARADRTTTDTGITWDRRTRLSTRITGPLAWSNPVGESPESYEVDVYTDGTFTTVVRTLTSSTPAVTYTSTNQVTDFGSNQSTLYLRIYQLSATVGRGYALQATI